MQTILSYTIVLWSTFNISEFDFDTAKWHDGKLTPGQIS